MSGKTFRFQIIFLFVFSIIFINCGGRRTPNLDAIFAKAKTQVGKRPVIIIPGILGSKLINSKTKEVVWLNLSDSKDDRLSLPISPDLSKNRDNLVPDGIIKKTKIFSFLPEVSIYDALISSMKTYGGYRQGDWENPSAEGARDTFYVFDYDWRLDNVTNARLLVEKVKKLKRELGKPNLQFNVIAHSMGGLIARYAAMYGDADLPEGDAKPVPTWAGAKYFNKIFMFGTPNEGSMSAFESLLNGYSVPTFTGKFKIDSLSNGAEFSAPSIFQLLPPQISFNLYDENLKPLAVDLYDPKTWKKYDWGAISNQNFLKKFKGQVNALKENGISTEYADTSVEDLNAYFAAVLNRAKKFHEALDADTAVPAGISLFTFGSDCESTLAGAILRRDSKTNNWITIFNPKSYKTSDGVKITKDAMRKVLYAPGDGRVTRSSLLAETIAEENSRNSLFRRSLPVFAAFFCEDHSDLPNNKIVIDNFLTALMAEAAL